MNDELHKIWKEAVMVFSRYFPGSLVEVLRNTKRGHSTSRMHAPSAAARYAAIVRIMAIPPLQFAEPANEVSGSLKGAS
jgi:hypothetical protein